MISFQICLVFEKFERKYGKRKIERKKNKENVKNKFKINN